MIDRLKVSDHLAVEVMIQMFYQFVAKNYLQGQNIVCNTSTMKEKKK